MLLQVATDETVTDTINSLSDDNFVELFKTIRKFQWRFLIDFVSVLVLIRFVYYRTYKRSDLFFTFFIFNIIIFLICFLLNKVELSMGAAFGLFAVFSMLRYRTEDISIKDMSYLFLVIAIGLIAAVTKIKNTSDLLENLFLVLINAIIIGTAWIFETNLFIKKEAAKVIVYENIELVRSDREAELIADIKLRTGLNIHRISITKIDFLKDAALIKVYYYEKN
ncbi:MAG: hypothetical protein K0S32_394 [Bacteroidetes bacterium]|jgi:hypothetical protein|nr:hypothetical protein [Bacteroidota bacterium]